MLSFLNKSFLISWMTFNFFDDMLLFLLILGQLLLLSYFNFIRPERLKMPDGTVHHQGLPTKARFYILLRFVYYGLIAILLLKLFLFLFYYTQVDAVINFITYCSPVTNNLLLRDDPFTRIINILITLGGLYYLFYLERFIMTRVLQNTVVLELPLLMLIIILSLRLLINANDLILIILALETVSFCVVILIATQSVMGTRWSPFALEAAVKYFVLNAVAVSFLLLGTLFFYFSTASTTITVISATFLLFPYSDLMVFEPVLVGTIFFFFGYFLKLGVAPLHNWVPDVYDGAELPITILLMTLVSPVLLIKLCLISVGLIYVSFLDNYMLVIWFFYIGGICSVFFGTFGAITQTRLKRFLAYTGLTHLGFIFLAFSSHTILGYATTFIYIIVYIIMLHGFFTLTVLTVTEMPLKPFVDLNDLKNISALGIRFIVFFLIIVFSFAGAPPLAGFFIKALVFESLVVREAFLTLFFLVIMVVINAYLYLRLINLLLFEERLASLLIQARWTQYRGRVHLGTANKVHDPYFYIYVALVIISVLLGLFLPYLDFVVDNARTYAIIVSLVT